MAILRITASVAWSANIGFLSIDGQPPFPLVYNGYPLNVALPAGKHNIYFKTGEQPADIQPMSFSKEFELAENEVFDLLIVQTAPMPKASFRIIPAPEVSKAPSAVQTPPQQPPVTQTPPQQPGKNSKKGLIALIIVLSAVSVLAVASLTVTLILLSPDGNNVSSEDVSAASSQSVSEQSSVTSLPDETSFGESSAEPEVSDVSVAESSASQETSVPSVNVFDYYYLYDLDVLPASVLLFEDEYDCLITAEKALNIRSGPGMDYEVVHKIDLPKDKEIYVTLISESVYVPEEEEYKYWAVVAYTEGVHEYCGWVSTDFISK